MRNHRAIPILLLCAAALVGAILDAGQAEPPADPAMGPSFEAPAAAQSPGVCENLSCPALQDLCLKDGDKRACALHNLCC